MLILKNEPVRASLRITPMIILAGLRALVLRLCEPKYRATGDLQFV